MSAVRERVGRRLSGDGGPGTAASRTRGPARVPAVVVAAIAGAWAVALVAEASGGRSWLHHDALLDGQAPPRAALLLFLIAWQVMVAAMMLPSSIPMIRLFAAVAVNQERRARLLAHFIAGYALVWTAFGAVAFAGDAVLHAVVEHVAWLEPRPWVIGSAVLAVAGAFQFSGLKDRCLDACRHPAAFLLPRYRRGTTAAFRLGRTHGLYCLGCCWALMLLMFAAGLADLRWMAALGALMAYEKIGRHGRAVARAAGVLLLGWAALVLLQPAWLPPALRGPG
jgi:predicted metal-binding membrane protein